MRTRNWCPGEWDAPGRLKIHVGGKPLETTFGTEEGWAWQKGGSISITSTSTKLTLEDLTGFEGRCDALFFSKKADFVPPVDVEPMKAWRRELMGIPIIPKRQETFDVIVVGGGLAGCGAAIAAARAGIKVALVHDRPVLGGNASGEIRVHTLGISGKSSGIIGDIDSKHWKNGSDEAYADDKKRHASVDKEKNITQFLS